MSQETHAGRWIAFRQPVRRVVASSARASKVARTGEANPGEVWEETEFWIDLSWEIDPDGSLGIRQLLRVAVPPGRSASPWTITSAGCSRTLFPACRRRRPKKG